MPTGVLIIRILLSAFLGAIVGIERELHGCAAGLRTHILVSVGSAVFMIASIVVAPMYSHLGDVDPSRIAANIVTGVGFLGAGAIIRYGVSVRGLTTAASIWAVAAVGLSAGAGMYVASLVTSGVVVSTLFLSKLEEKMESKRRMKKLIVRVASQDSFSKETLAKILNTHGGNLHKIEFVSDPGSEGGTYRVELTLPRMNRRGVVSEILALSGVKGIEWVNRV